MAIKQNENTILKRVIEQTLARYALMFGEPAEKIDSIEFPGECILARVSFRNYANGTVSIAVPIKFCLVLAANAIGLDTCDKMAEENKFDAIKEFVNVAAGHYVSELFGNDKKIDLLPPMVNNMGRDDWKSEIKGSQFALFVDGFPVIIKVSKER